MTTIRDSIVDAASSVAGHPVKAGPTITDALDALTDALAGHDVAGGKTIADAFAILGEHLEDNAPSGKITITENGTGIDVARYATADVSVSGGGGTAHAITATGDAHVASIAVVDAVDEVETMIAGVRLVVYPYMMEGYVPDTCTITDASSNPVSSTFNEDLGGYVFTMPDSAVSIVVTSKAE